MPTLLPIHIAAGGLAIAVGIVLARRGPPIPAAE